MLRICTLVKNYKKMSDNLKKEQLKKHKMLATGLFVLMAILYIVSIYFIQNHTKHWLHYLKAFSEAGMVGALADWFAVTALFKYPLGIKVPHTNLITNNKDALGKNLGNFVSTNFLTAKNIRPYISELSIKAYLNEWLSKQNNIEIIKVEAVKVGHRIINNLDDEQIASILTRKGMQLTDEIKLEKLASTSLLYMLEQNEHQRLMNIILPQAQMYVENNRELIYKKVVEKQPILGLIGGKAVTNQLISGITTFLQEVENDINHPIRLNITDKLYQIVDDLKDKDSWQVKFNAIKNEFITQEKLSEYATDLWLKLKNDLLQKLDNPNSALNNYLNNSVDQMIKSFKDDHNLHERIDKIVRQYVYKIVLKNSKEVGHIITNTVHQWDGNELSEKLELEVGKDLQFIRINGTLVGGMVGLFIYIVTQWLT